MKYLFAIVFSFCVIMSAMADVTLVQKMQTGAVMGQPARNSVLTMYMKGNKMRVDDKDNNTATVFDLQANKMYVINNTKKEVYSMGLDQLKAAGEYASQLGQGALKMKSDVKKTGKKEKINGFNCEEYAVTSTGPMMTISGNHWVTQDVDTKEFDTFKQFAEDATKIIGPDAMGNIEGLPIRTNMTIKIMGKSVTNSSEVQSITNGAISDSMFALPSGYSQKEMPKLPQKP